MELNLLLIEKYLLRRFRSPLSPIILKNRSEWDLNYLEKALRDMNFYHDQRSGRDCFKQPTFFYAYNAFSREKEKAAIEHCERLIQSKHETIIALNHVIRIKKFTKKLKEIRASTKLDKQYE